MLPSVNGRCGREEVGVDSRGDGTRGGKSSRSKIVSGSSLKSFEGDGGSCSVRDLDGDSVALRVDLLNEPEPSGSGHVVDRLVVRLLEGLEGSVGGVFFGEGGFEVGFHGSVPSFGVGGLGRKKQRRERDESSVSCFYVARREREKETHEAVEEERVVEGLTSIAENERSSGIVGGLPDGLEDSEMVVFGS